MCIYTNMNIYREREETIATTERREKRMQFLNAMIDET